MSRLIFILGQPGTGKTSALRNLKKDEVGYISVTGKELPFKSDIKPVVSNSITGVKEMVVKSKKPIIVVDDVGYLFMYQVFGRVNEKDQWAVFKDIGNDFFQLIKTIIDKPTNQNIYLFGHIELNDEHLVQLKTAGHTIRNNIVPEGLSNIVLEAVNDLGEFVFKVRSDGSGVKSPQEMFSETTIPNDLKIIDSKINTYYKQGAK